MDFPDNLRVMCDTCHTVTFRHTKSHTESQQPRPGEEQQILSVDWRQLRWQPLVSGLANSVSLTPQCPSPAVSACTV